MKRTTLRTLSLSSVLLSLALSAAPALAQAPSGKAASAQDIAVAEAAFNEGVKLAQAGNCKDAVTKLELSQKIDPASGTAMNLGKCYEQLGRTASAYGAYSEAAGLARVKVNEERRKEAEERMAALAPNLVKIEVHVKKAEQGLSLAIDGKPVNEQALSFALPVDPGNRTIEVSAPGKKPWKTIVLVSSTPGVTPVDVPPLEDLPAPPPPPSTSADNSMSTGAKVAAIGLGVVGVGLLGVGIGYGVDTLGKNADSKKFCTADDPNKCSQQGVDLRNQAYSSATISNIGIFAGVGALAVAGGVVLVSRLSSKPATSPKPDDHAPPPTASRPTITAIGLGLGNVTLQGQF